MSNLKDIIHKLSIKDLDKLQIEVDKKTDWKNSRDKKSWTKLIQKEKRKKTGIKNNKKALKKGIILQKKGDKLK